MGRLYGKPKPMAEQARLVLKTHLSLASRHQAKAARGIRGSRTTGRIHALRTFEKYAGCLKLAGEWAQAVAGLTHLRDLSPALAQRYLQARRARGLGQKQLDADRNALQFVTGAGSLARVTALARTPRQARAYTVAQVRHVARCQSARNALSTLIAHAAGLRAHELLTLRRREEASASAHRHWHAGRFAGRAGVRYVVTGKGGLRREVLLPETLAQRLEARRLSAPRTVTDLRIHYAQHYDIGGGNAWSRSFTDASRRALGWSTGAHGLRHAYAQERLAELQAGGHPYPLARTLVSQELGHFRGDVVETYLR
jgi:integrase